MDIPRFYQEHLNPKLCQQDIGCAFQEFVHEALLNDYPDLHLFPGMGKDGAIDLSQTTPASRTIIECKYIGKDSFEDIVSIWRNVASKLEKHLAGPSGPTKGQAQYMPWYRVDLPIREYIFCVSSTISNQKQIDELNIMIVEFFRNLSIKHEHLNHLNGLKVEVLDWNACCSLLKKSPHLIFRWFPKTRISGFVPLYDSLDAGTFHSYLNSEKLTYYSRSQHLKVMSAPHGVDIPDEENLLNILEKGDTTGLIVTGGGGVGKTRLMLEIGRSAQNKKWLVFRVQSQLKDNSLEQLAHQINPETSVLLLIDYIETQKEFYDIVETLNGINDTYFLHFSYIACCRTSYYKTIGAASRHIRVDLSPPVQDFAINWYENYQKQTVIHILKESGLEVSDSHLDICRNKPIFAVLISYLYCSGRQPDLAELLKEKDFGKWITKRLQLSFGQTDIYRDLALLTALFPMQLDKVSLLDPKQGILFDKLATDGWIEEQVADELQNFDMWVIAHDVLADQILLSYFDSIPHTYERFIDELFSQAKSIGCLRSAIITLQRLQPELGSLYWSKILLKNVSKDIIAWRDVRDILIRTSLLSPIEIISMLGEQEELWKGAELESDFQNAIGWLTRWTINQKEPVLDDVNRSILDLWIRKASSYPTRSNFILTWGLRFSAEAVREPALRWIQMHPVMFQTHYLLVAWMECHLPLEDIASSVQQWIDKFKLISHLNFVAKAWLDAKGELEVVCEPIKAWLEKHEADVEAGFVYKSWLDAKGELEMVREPIKAWLEKHEADVEAGFVYKSWLDAKGELEMVREPIKTWLEKHEADAEASFVYHSLLNAKGELEMVRESIKAWLEKHEVDAEAHFVYRSLLNAKGELGMVREPIKAWLEKHEADVEAGFVYKSWLDAKGELEMVREPIKAWLEKHEADVEAGFVYKSWLDAKGELEVVCEPIKAWLEKHEADAELDFVYKAWLNAKGELEMVRESIKAWLEKHEADAEAHFIYKAWLDAGGETELIREPINAWLEKNETDTVAKFVYKAWLDAGGDTELVRESIKVWLERHGDDAEVDFVYKAWLDAGGDFSVVSSYTILWLHQNYDKEEAVYLTKFLAKQRDIPGETVKDILIWCQKFPNNDDAIWRLTQLNRHLLNEGVGEEAITASEAVLNPLILIQVPLIAVIRGQINMLFSYLISAPRLRYGQLRNRVDKLFLAWLRNPASFGSDHKPHINLQRLTYVQRVIDLIVSGALDISTDYEHIKRFLHWVNSWEPERKSQLYRKFDFLKHNYPVPGLWDIVKIR